MNRWCGNKAIGTVPTIAKHSKILLINDTICVDSKRVCKRSYINNNGNNGISYSIFLSTSFQIVKQIDGGDENFERKQHHDK